MKGGGTPEISDYLVEVEEHSRPLLVRLLLEIELETRNRRGEKVTLSETCRRFPEYAASVTQAFAVVARRLSNFSKASSVQPSIVSDQRLLLRVVSGPLAGQQFQFTRHSTLMAGRARNAQLRLSDDPRISRFHCRFEMRPPECMLVDLGSRNGTFVNGRKIEAVILSEGDRIQIGETCLVYDTEVPEAAEPPTPAVVCPHRMNTVLVEGLQHEIDSPHVPGYVLERELGHGSMGAVYVARRASDGTLFAIKVLHPSVTSNPRNIQRFVREASVIMRLKHKRIVECFEFGLGVDLPFLVMEYIEQVSLSDLLEAMALKSRIRCVAGIMVRVLEGLHYAHLKKIVHRDLKPSNLLVFQSGRKLSVKLADFGLAKDFMNAGFSGFSTSNEICGTIAYMPPEQIVDCRRARPACDIYAAGVCLYYLLSGRLPHEGISVSAQISMILNRRPTPLQQYVDGLPEGLLAVVERALQKNPANRFPDAAGMLEALMPFARRAEWEAEI